MNIGYPPEVWVPFGKPLSGYAPWLGVELELWHPRGYQETVLETVERALNSEQKGFVAAGMFDGSVQGAEFVTHPAGLKTHARLWPGVLSVLESQGFEARSDSGGLHVHVSRKGMLPGQLEFLVALVFYGGPYWEHFQRRVQGREGARWAPGDDVFTERVCGNTASALEQSRAYIETLCNTADHAKRYRRLNLVPDATVEFRQGHTTLDLTRLLSRVELADALVRFTHTAARKGPVMRLFPRGLPTPRAFMGWVRKVGTWPALAGLEV